MSVVARLFAGAAAGFLAIVMVGCSPPGSHVLGQNPTEIPGTLDSVRQFSGQGPVTISGIMIEKCPEAGCWFVLKDGTGSLKVDTKTAGFVVVDVPLNRRLTVVGQVITNGTEVQLAASGVRY